MSEDLAKKTGRALKWSAVTEILAKLVTPVVNIFLARLLLPEAFGAVATVTMIITFAEVFTDAGFQKYIVQHEFENEEDLNNGTNVAFWTNFALSALIVSLIAVFRHQIAELVGSRELGNAIFAASFSIIAVSFSSIQMARFKRDFDFKSLFFVRILSSVIPLVVTIPLAFLFRNFWALIIGTLSVNLFNAVALTLKSKWKPKFYYSFKRFKQMFSFTFWTLLESLLIWVTANADIFIVGRALNDYYLGLYKTSITTINSYMSIITSAVLPILFSALSRCQNNSVEFKKTYLRFFKYASLFLFPMSAGIFIYRELVTYILLGSKWSEAAGFIGLWGLMSGITIVMGQFSSEVFRSKGNPRLSMIAQLLHLAFLIPTVIITVSYGFEILYISRALIRVQSIIVSMLFLCIVYKFSFLEILKNILPAMASTMIMAAVGFVLLKFVSSTFWEILTIFVCIITYFLVLLALFPKTRKDILQSQVLKRILKKK